MIKTSTRPAYNGVWLKQEKCISDIKFSAYPAFKTTCQGDRTSGIFVAWPDSETYNVKHKTLFDWPLQLYPIDTHCMLEI